MSRVLRSVRKRKKGCTLGAVDVIDREGYAELEVDAKVELIRSLVPLGLMHIEELLDEEVTALAGERYARKDPSVGGRRHGSNPGTVGLAGQRVPIRVPRIRHVTEREIPRRSLAIETALTLRLRYHLPLRQARGLGGQAPALGVGEPETARTELLSEDAILFLERVNDVTRLLVDPARDGHDEELQHLGKGDIRGEPSKGSRRSRTSRPGERPA